MGVDRKLTYAGVLGEGTTLAVVFRHVICLLIGVMWLVAPPRPVPTLIATVLLMLWSVIRLRGRDTGPAWAGVDLLVVVAYLAVPASAATSASAIGGSTQVKVAAAVVISFGIEQRARWSVGSLAVVLAALFAGFRNVADLDLGRFLGMFAVLYLAVLWALAVAARQMVLRAAEGVDASLEALRRTRLWAAVTGARRRYEREQLALMHDTAASTLLLVGTGVEIGAAQLAAQARRDLAILEAGVPVFDDDGEVDLVVLLSDIACECRTSLSMCGLGTLRIRPAVAWAVTAAVREALTNVDRHAHARSVRVEVGRCSVAIIDDGIGFTRPRDASAGRHGIRRSIIARMSAIGGAGTVSGVAGGGTRVDLTWTSSSGSTETTQGVDSVDTVVAVNRLELKLAFALAGIAIVDVTLQSSRAWSLPAPTPPGWAHAGLAAVVVACTLPAMLAVQRRRVTTVLLMTIAVSVSVALNVLLPASEVLGETNWSVGAVGWTVVALGLHESRSVTITALAGWWLLVWGVVLTRAPSTDMVILLGYHTATILCTQVLIALFAGTIHRVVEVVAERDRERRTIEVATAVDRVLKQECQRRYRDQLRSVAPILGGLADGSMSPKSSAVIAVARVEYGRLRRLFDRADRMDHWLLDDLSTAIDRAEARGVRVTAEAASDLPDISDEARTGVSAAMVTLLATSRSHARIVLTAEPGQLVVSVVSDAPAEAASRGTDLSDGVESELVVDEESEAVWLRLRCPCPDPEGAIR